MTRKYQPFTFEHQKEMMRLWPDHTLRDIAAIMGRDASVIRARAIKLGLGTKPRSYRKNMGCYRDFEKRRSMRVHDMRNWEFSWEEIGHEIKSTAQTAKKIWTNHVCAVQAAT